MTLRWLLASLHLIALALGAAAVFARARALRATQSPGDLRPVFVADNLWGLAALLWIGTGVWRAFGPLEKGAEYYFSQPLFHAKLTVFVVIVLLELRPMITLLRWRRERARGETSDISAARTFARISDVQFLLVFIIVFLATAIARGIQP